MPVSNLSSSNAPGPDKVAYPMLKHLLALAWIFFTSSIFPGLRIPFLPSRRHLLLFPSTRWESFSTLLLPSGLSLLPLASQSCLNASFYLVYSSFWNLILFSLPARPVSTLPTLDQILYLSQSISDGFSKPRPGSRTILSTIDFSKAFDSVWHPTLFHKFISAGLPPCFARRAQSFLSDRRACVVYQNHKSRSFRVRRDVPQGSVLGHVLFLFSLMIFWPLCFFPSAALFMLTIWPFDPSPPRSPLRWRPHKKF